MKKRKLRIPALLLALSILTSTLAGCAQTPPGAESSGPAGGSAAADDNIDLSGSLPIIKDPSKFEKMSAVVVVGGNVKIPVKEFEETQRWVKETGVEFEWQEIPAEGAQEKINLMVNSNNLPDIFFGSGGINTSAISQNLENDIFLPVDDLVEKYMPRLKEIYLKSPKYKAAVTYPNGKMYGFPWIEEMYGLTLTPGVLYINTKWLEAVNKKMPTTLDEFVDVLHAFHDAGDLNGNGKADEYAFAGSFDSNVPGSLASNLPMNHFTGLFGRPNTQENKQTDNLQVVDGKITFTAADSAYRDTASFFNNLYKEGLIDPDSFSPAVDGGPAFLKKLAGDVPVVGAMTLWNPDNFIPNWEIRDQYEPTPRLTSGKGKLGSVNNLYEMDQGINCVITKNCKYPEVVAAFCDYLYDPWHSVKANWGKQFEEYPDGILRYPRRLPDGSLDPDLKAELTVPTGFETFGEARANSSVNHPPLMVSNDNYGVVNDYPATTWVFYQAQLFQGKKDILNELTAVPPMLLTKEEQDTVSRIQPLLKGIVDRYTNQWILDGNAEASWDDYLTELKNSGLDEFVNTYQQVYDRFLSNVG